VNYEQLMALARQYAGQRLETVKGTKFTVGVYIDCPVFVPESTGLGRSDGRNAAERFLARYNDTGSLRPTDYGDVTRNASYFIGLIKKSASE
jgi:hypothetical protein